MSMVRKPVSGVAGAVLLCLLAVARSGPGEAATYVQMTDGELFRQSELIAEVSILERLPAVEGSAPVTEHLALVERVLRGSVERSTLVLTTPGGLLPSGMGLHVPGAPRFEVGDRVLVFLTGDHDSGYRLVQLGMGAFFKRGEGRHAFALRSLADATVFDENFKVSVELIRNYRRFVRWLDRRADGKIESPDYFLPRRPAITAPYRLVTIGGMNVRWFDFDDGGTVPWRIRNTDSSNTQPEFVQALNVWSRDPVSLALASGTNSTAGFQRSDNVNAIIFGDPNNTLPGTFVCPNGGIVGIAGFWFSSLIGHWEGQDYRRVREADIVINDGADCLLNNNRRGTAELFTRELGFSLGIDFSNVPNATMSATLHNDGRGAFVTADDIAALERLYGKNEDDEPDDPGPGPGPNPSDPVEPPTKLKVRTPKSNLVKLSWKDNSKDETQFEIWRRIGEKKWKLWETKPANKKKLKSKDVKPGKTYSFRVRALRGSEVSEFSNEVTVTMPVDRLAAPENLAVEATSSTGGTLTWEDKTSGEKLFQIERREGDGEWSVWMTAEANATSLDFDDGASGATYTFRIRAKKGSKVSDYSNEATVTMP